MTNPGEDAGETASSDSSTPASEPESAGYEAPPIEQSQVSGDESDESGVPPEPTPEPGQERTQVTEQPAYTPPPAYNAPPAPPPGYDTPGFPPAHGYPPPSFPPPAYPPPPGPPGYAPPPYPDPASYGAPSYPPPPYGAPAPGYPPPTGYPAPGYAGGYALPGQKTNSLAIASLVSSCIGILPFICGLGSIIGIVLGVVSLNQIKTTGEGGRGLAIAGIAVGAVTFLLSILFTIAMLSG